MSNEKLYVYRCFVLLDESFNVDSDFTIKIYQQLERAEKNVIS